MGSEIFGVKISTERSVCENVWYTYVKMLKKTPSINLLIQKDLFGIDCIGNILKTRLHLFAKLTRFIFMQRNLRTANTLFCI